MLDRILARLGAAYRLELRLLTRHWSFFVLHGLWILLLAATYGGAATMGTARVLLGTVMRFIALSLLSLVSMFVAGISASRRRQTHFDQLEDAFPTGLEVPLGRWLACLTAMASFLIEVLIMALMIGPLGSFLASAPLFVAESVLLLGFFTAGTWWLTSLFGLRRWGYPLLAVIWIGFLVAPGILDNLGVPGSSLLNVTGNGQPSWTTSELFGRLILGTLPDWFDLFYGGLLLLFVAAFAWRAHRQRFQRRSAMVAGLLATALIATLAGLGGYVTTAAATTARYAAQRAFGNAGRPGEVMPADLPEAVAAYDLDLDLTDPGLPHFSADMEIINRGETPIDSLTMTLTDSLDITDSSLPLTRDGSRLAFTLPEPLGPGETAPLHLAYQGTVQRAEDWGGNLRYFAFIKPGGVRLPLGAGWYPLVGWTMSATVLAADIPARFHLQVEGADGLTFASNLPATGERTFDSEGATWALLYGSPQLVATQVAEEVTLVTARDLLPTLRPTIETRYLPGLAYLAPFFPDFQVYPLLILAVDNPTAGQPGGDMATAEQRLMLLDPANLMGERPFWQAQYDYRQMITTLGGSAIWSLADVLGPFLWSQSQHDGDLAQTRAELADQIATNPALATLIDLYAQYGDAGITRLLRRGRADSATLLTFYGSFDRLAAWMRETLDAD
jgi:hypothetical protein